MKDRNRIVFVTVAPSCTGKSTWAKEFIRTNPSFMRFNRDSYRRMLKNQSYLTKQEEKLAVQMMYSNARTALINGYDVVIDNTHCNQNRIKEVIREFEDVADIRFKVFPFVSLDELMRRNKERAKREGYNEVPEWRLIEMVESFLELRRTFDFTPIKKRLT